MLRKGKHTFRDYKTAFSQLTGAGDDEFLIKKECGALALFKGRTYRICHYDDLLSDFKTYFNPDYSQIYTETPFALWEVLFHKHHEITDDDLIIDIFNAWELYWKAQRKGYARTKTYEQDKARSRQEFNLLIEALQQAPGSFIKNAIELSDITLIPVIALALRGRFDSEENFYSECVDILIDQFPHLFCDDGNFNKVEIQTVNSDYEAFYIYEPDYEYED